MHNGRTSNNMREHLKISSVIIIKHIGSTNFIH